VVRDSNLRLWPNFELRVANAQFVIRHSLFVINLVGL
jgi:hypothetical protein